jgi:hypothetical protein
MADFQFYLQLGKHTKVGWVGDDSHLVFGQKFSGEKGKVCPLLFVEFYVLCSA